MLQQVPHSEAMSSGRQPQPVIHFSIISLKGIDSQAVDVFAPELVGPVLGRVFSSDIFHLPEQGIETTAGSMVLPASFSATTFSATVRA